MIGEKIRNLRKQKGMTLKTLAAGAGVTASYISQLERNLVDPSLSTLRRISKVFDMSMSSFLDDDVISPVVMIRAGSGRKLAPQDAISYEYLTPISTDSDRINMEIIRFELAPGSWDSEECFVHTAEECTFLLSGRMQLLADGTLYEMFPGDSVYLRSNVPHRSFNPGSEPAVGFSCASPVV